MAKKKTCFVIIGYGVKQDYATGRNLDLDKTFNHLIKPVFDAKNIDCFRAIDRNKTGVIDLFMYEWILRADIVLADISTLNPNVIYELGVRHALRPYSTIIISEKDIMKKLPFDINHTVIHEYEHLGSDISKIEVEKFGKKLGEVIDSIVKKPKKDSPVYTFLTELKAPKIEKYKGKANERMDAPKFSFSELIEPAEKALFDKDFKLAELLYSAALMYDNSDVFLRQRLALSIYSGGKPTLRKALEKAEKILAPLNPNTTTDQETIGLSGAINKKLYEITKDEHFLNKALSFYQRGYYIKHDYYNGINAAFLSTLKAVITENENESIYHFYHANSIREDIINICKTLIKSQDFKKRDDRIWVLQSLAQAYLGLERKDDYESTLKEVVKNSKGKFDIEIFDKQNSSLLEYLEQFKYKHQSA